jgi:acetylornithine aminotransferase/acetylornithine/N-succinyldiaminopimelate aminotransferase
MGAMQDYLEYEQQYLMHTYKRQPLFIARGAGVRVWDEQGREYLDFLGGIAVNILGHCHPAVVAAVQAQVATLIHTSNLFYTGPQLEVAKFLCEHSPFEKVFFANSGAEANEGAFKLARKYGQLHLSGAYKIISALGSFHGRTLAAVAATGQAKYQKPFLPMPEGFVNVPFNDLAALRASTDARTCAVLLEAVQGESGVHPATQDFLRGVRALCDERGMLLMVDEVQTGMGRTGKWFAFEHYGVVPDVATMAKGLAGGLPISALLARGKALVFEPGDHAATFGGGPTVCAAALATLRTIERERLIDHAAALGKVLLHMLGALPGVAQVRGLGLMVGIDLEAPIAPQVTAEALKQGLIINATGDRTVRMLPALIVTESDLEEGVARLRRALEAVLATAVRP